MKRFVTVLIFTIAAMLSSAAQQRWSLQECIDYALKHNISIQMKNIEQEVALENWKRSKLEFIPSLNFSMEHNLNWGRSVDLQTLEIVNNRLTQSTGIGIGTSIYILDGFSKIFDTKIAKLEYQIGGLEKESAIEEITISVIRAYMQITLSSEIISAIGENLESLRKQKEIVETFVSSNRAHISNLLEIKGEESALEMELTNAIYIHQRDIIALKNLLNFESDEPFEIAPYFPEPVPYNEQIFISRNFELLKKYHPKISSLNKRLEADEFLIKRAKGKLFPTIGISGSYSTFYSSTAAQSDGSTHPFTTQLKENINPSVGITLAIPIFNNGKYKAEIKRHTLQKRQNELQLVQQQQLIEKRIRELLLETQKCFSRMENAEKNMRYMEESLEYAKAKFENGKMDSATYTDIFRRSNRARSEHLKEKYQYLFNMEIIKFYNSLSTKYRL